MDRFFVVHALCELAKNEQMRREMSQIGLMYMGAVIIAVLSFPAFQYLA